jgi:hypothetical protein
MIQVGKGQNTSRCEVYPVVKRNMASNSGRCDDSVWNTQLMRCLKYLLFERKGHIVFAAASIGARSTCRRLIMTEALFDVCGVGTIHPFLQALSVNRTSTLGINNKRYASREASTVRIGGIFLWRYSSFAVLLEDLVKTDIRRLPIEYESVRLSLDFGCM